MGKATRRPGGQKVDKDPPILSQEYFLQNQADLVSSACLIIVSGFLFKPTKDFSSKFVTVQHSVTNITEEDSDEKEMYGLGRADVCMTLFYALFCIACHAVENDYIWEKLARRLHLSKTKTADFMEQGSVAPFHLAVVIGAVYVFIKEGIFSDLGSIWENTPADSMPMFLKYYWIVIMGFVVHLYPEMYFMRVKKEDMPNKIIGYTAYLIPIVGAYITGLVYPATIILVIHCAAEMLRAISDVLECTGNETLSQPMYRIWSVGFIIARNSIAAITVVCFFKLKSKTPDQISQLRFASCSLVLLILLGLQLYLGWKFVQTVLTWRRTAREITQAQKKADNFWAQRKDLNKEAKKVRAEKKAAKSDKED